MTELRLGKTSTLISDQTYYLPTYLHEKDNPDGESWLFLRRVVRWVVASGRKHHRTITDVRYYPDGEAMVADLESHPEWLEAPSEADGNPQWVPRSEE